MAKKSGFQTAGDLAHLAKALYDIVKAFLQGGWGAAVLQALKHYWPQILTVALVLLLLPTIIFCCLPMMMFGFESSTDTEIVTLTLKADAVSVYYDNYELYLDEWVENIKSMVIDSVDQDTETSGTTSETQETVQVEYEVVCTGSKIQKNRFIALHAVTVGNDLNAGTEADIRSFAGKCISYTVTPAEEDTESETDGTEASDVESEPIKMILNICYLAPDEIMSVCGFTDSDKNWAELIYKTLEGGTV